MKLIRDITKVLKKIDAVLFSIQKFLAVVLLLAMVFVGGIQVFGRFFFSFSPIWTEEFLRFFMIYLGFVTISMTSRADGHVAVDVLQEKIKNNKVRMYLYVITRLLMVTLLVILIPWSVELTMKSTASLASTVKLSWSWIYGALPVGFTMCIVSILAHLPDYAEKVLKGEK